MQSDTTPSPPHPSTNGAWRLLVPAATSLALLLGSVAWLHATELNTAQFVGMQRWTVLYPDVMWSMLTLCGTGIAAYALISPALVWHPRWMASAISAGIFAAIYTRLLKAIFRVPRPAGVFDSIQIHVVGQTLRANSFPSGHAVTAFMMASTLTFASRRPVRTASWAVPIALLIAISRVGVGAHWPADLLAGAAGGWIAGALGVAVAERWRSWDTVRGIRTMAFMMMAVGVALAIVELGQPLAVPLQRALAILAFMCGLAAAVRPRARAS